LVALSGCLRGIQCGNSSSAVGDAATSAVVTGIVAIVAACGIFCRRLLRPGDLTLRVGQEGARHLTANNRARRSRNQKFGISRAKAQSPQSKTRFRTWRAWRLGAGLRMFDTHEQLQNLCKLRKLLSMGVKKTRNSMRPLRSLRISQRY
jgi:Permease MlaE